MGIVLAFDYGLRRIGVAVGNAHRHRDRAARAAGARGVGLERIRRLIGEWGRGCCCRPAARTAPSSERTRGALLAPARSPASALMDDA
jgi:hypothetical protein